MTTIVNILAHTPIWVFPLIGLVLWLGVINLRRREVPLRSLLAFPLILLSLSIGNFIGTSAPAKLALVDWLGCTAAGTLIGWRITPRPVAVDLVRRTLTLPGSAVPLLVIATIVVLRYSFGYLYGRYPELLADPGYALTLIGGGRCSAVSWLDDTEGLAFGIGDMPRRSDPTARPNEQTPSAQAIASRNSSDRL
jgi:hypothetical protein